MMNAIFFLFTALAPTVQTEAPPVSPWTERHAVRELARREAEFFRAWDEAPGARWHEFALREIERSRGAGEPRTLNPSPAAFNDAARLLRRAHDPAGELSAKQRFVDRLALAATPGILEGSPDGKRTAITVFVHSLYSGKDGIPGEPFELTLTWHGPSGETQHARREAVHPLAVAQGFEMYVQSPEGPPGTWWILPSVTSAQGESLEGHALRFEVVPVLEELERSLAAEVSGDELEGLRADRARRALDDLKALRDTGLQPESMESLLANLGYTPMEAERTDRERLRDGSGPGGALSMDPREFGAAQVRGEVLLLMSSEERRGSALRGSVQEDWANLARAGWRITEFEGSLSQLEGEADSLQRRLENRTADAPLWVVARGDAAGRLLLGCFGETGLGKAFRAGADGLVLEGAVPPRLSRGAPRPPRWPDGPRRGLILTAGAEASLERSFDLAGEGQWTWLARKEPLFLARRELPRRLAELLDR